MHVIKTLMVNYDTPRQYLNFNRTDYNQTDLWQTNFASYEESSGRGMFIFFYKKRLLNSNAFEKLRRLSLLTSFMKSPPTISPVRQCQRRLLNAIKEWIDDID